MCYSMILPLPLLVSPVEKGDSTMPSGIRVSSLVFSGYGKSCCFGGFHSLTERQYQSKASCAALSLCADSIRP